MKNKKNIIIGTSIVVALIIIVAGIFWAINKNNDTTSNNQEIESNFTLDKSLKNDLEEFNKRIDKFFVETWDENKYLSSYSYFVSNSGEEIPLSKIDEFYEQTKETNGEYTVPETLQDVVIHFVKPKSLKTFLGDKISDEDPEILTVYSALPVEGGMYVSSMVDIGGFLSDEQYKNFVLSESWIHGDIIKPLPTDEEYKNITEAVFLKDKALKDGNIKHILCDNKYAVIVISSQNDPSYIKQFALQKNEDNSWTIIVDGLEDVDPKIFINYGVTDFALDLLPLYSLDNYEVSSDFEEVINQLKETGDIVETEVLTYSCGAMNFMYFEFESGKKTLLHTNMENITNIYEVDNYKTALSKMLELEENPPVFILKFQE